MRTYQFKVDDHVLISQPKPDNDKWRGFRGLITQSFAGASLKAMRDVVTVQLLLSSTEEEELIRCRTSEIEPDTQPPEVFVKEVPVEIISVPIETVLAPAPATRLPAPVPKATRQKEARQQILTPTPPRPSPTLPPVPIRDPAEVVNGVSVMLKRNADLLGVTVTEMKSTPASHLPQTFNRSAPPSNKISPADLEIERELAARTAPKKTQKRGRDYVVGDRVRAVLGASHSTWKWSDQLESGSVVVLSDDIKTLSGAILWRVYDPDAPERGVAEGGGWWRQESDLEPIDSTEGL